MPGLRCKVKGIYREATDMNEAQARTFSSRGLSLTLSF